MKIKWYLSDLHACGAMRGEYVTREILTNHPNVVIDCKRDNLVSDIRQADLMIFQRGHQKQAFEFMRAAQQNGVKCIYETDDDMLAFPDGLGTLSDHFVKPDVRDAERSFLQYADAVIASTKTLAGALTTYTKAPIYICPNYLNAGAWQLPYAKRDVEVMRKRGVSFGWTNSPAHVLDIPVVSAAIKDVLDATENDSDMPVEFVSIGCIARKDLGEWAMDDKYEKRIRHIPWVHVDMFPYVCGAIDVAVCPLVDNQFNRSRSNVKWQQHAVLAVPCVVSAVGDVYGNVRNGVDGLVAKTDTDWRDMVLDLVKDRAKRELMGKEARLALMTHWDLATKYKVWMNTFNAVLDGRR